MRIVGGNYPSDPQAREGNRTPIPALRKQYNSRYTTRATYLSGTIIVPLQMGHTLPLLRMPPFILHLQSIVEVGGIEPPSCVHLLTQFLAAL